MLNIFIREVHAACFWKRTWDSEYLCSNFTLISALSWWLFRLRCKWLILRPRFIETLDTIALHLIFNSLLSALVYGQWYVRWFNLMCRWRGCRFTQMRVGWHKPVVGYIGLSCPLDVICFSPWKFHFSLQASLLFMKYCMDTYMRQLIGQETKCWSDKDASTHLYLLCLRSILRTSLCPLYTQMWTSLHVWILLDMSNCFSLLKGLWLL